MTLDERFVHVPTIKPGNSLFQGTPLVHKDTYDILGDDGTEKLDAFLKRIIEIRKQVITRVFSSAYGLPRNVRVFDFEKRLMLLIIYRESQYTDKELENLEGEVKEDNYSVMHVTGFPQLKNPGKVKFQNFVDSWLDDSGNAMRAMTREEIDFFKKMKYFDES